MCLSMVVINITLMVVSSIPYISYNIAVEINASLFSFVEGRRITNAFDVFQGELLCFSVHKPL